MTPAKYLLPLFFFTSSLLAQHKLSHPVMVSRDDAFTAPRSYQLAADTIKVLAALVQFQTDADNRTNGNGQFDLSAPATAGLDAPPRNRQYFRDHLTFLENYYRKASKGKAIVVTTLIDTVYTLPSQMQRYSPPKNGPNTLVGDLARDTWQQVDASGKVPDFSPYDCFVIFHAGVGRDIDVVGTLGYDPTPLDIPSLYLGLNAFKGFYGASYDGIPVRNGFKITNTIVMPETETRELPATPTNILLRLGINGLLCASVGNFLGLPDLFDTNTGRSGIGRFGLMDGQAIFSFAGTFPPEPSAWEKYWLGWIQPLTLSPGEQTVTLPAVAFSDTVYRIPISGSEYFLMENRNRDAGGNGQRITTSYNGVIRQQTFRRDTTGFSAFDLSAINGNVLDVEDLDWSLPGGVGTSGVFYDGGILIWHIDETVIAQGLATNGVNANPARRGVDVEEADGSQDIGQAYGQLDPGSGSEEGTAFDFWYQGSIAPVNLNEFSARSYPNTSSNSGANSHITIKDFGTRGARMSARVKVGDDQIALLNGFPKLLPNKLNSVSLTVAAFVAGEQPRIIVSSSGEPTIKSQRTPTPADVSKIYAWKPDGSGAIRSDGILTSVLNSSSSFIQSVAVDNLNADLVNEIITGEVSQGALMLSSIRAFSARPQPVDSLVAVAYSQTISRRVTTSPTIWKRDSIVAIGGMDGRLLLFRSRDGNPIDSIKISTDSSIVSVSQSAFPNGDGAFIVVATDGTISIIVPGMPQSNIVRKFGRPVVSPAISGNVNKQNEVAIAFATADGFLFLLDNQLNTKPGFPVRLGQRISTPLAMADIDGDGTRDIIAFSENKIFVYNYAGASLDNFPKTVAFAAPISSNPVVADVDGDGNVEVVAVSDDGLVVAYDKTGRLAPGFPLQAGRGRQSVAAFAFTQAPPLHHVGLAVASSEDGSVVAWRTTSYPFDLSHVFIPPQPWPQYQGDERHTGIALGNLGGSPVSAAFFPKERAYNWPNPVYDGKTHIRYFVSEKATVKIKILDLAGDLVAEFDGPGVARVDNEVEWNVKDVQSGVYLARIEATGSGKSEVAVVKVAVVK